MPSRPAPLRWAIGLIGPDDKRPRHLRPGRAGGLQGPVHDSTLETVLGGCWHAPEEGKSTMARIFITGSADGLGLMAGALLATQGHDALPHARLADRCFGATFVI